MKLDNPFSHETRLLFLYHHWCALCGRSDRGVELNHITGRDSNSAFNACPICRYCHQSINHNSEEEAEQFAYTFKFLYNSNYKPTTDDFSFIENHYERFKVAKLIEWLNLHSKNKNPQNQKS